MPDLIPRAVRIAIRDAVGGWGPYTIREIDDLYESFGFTERNPEVRDSGGQRRVRAESYQDRIDFGDPDAARRYLNLIEEVLLDVPSEPEDHRSPSERLRRSLRRAGITRGESGRLELPGAGEDVTLALETATQDLWNTQRLRLFLSHTSAHRKEVAVLAEALSGLGFSCFVAHDQIEPTREWQEVIELALRTCDVLVAYVTPDFSQSQWTEQEVGWALGRELVVVPLRIGANPYGFFGAYQALPIHDGEHARTTATAISRSISLAVFGLQRPGARRLLPRMSETAVDAFCFSRSYESTRQRYDILRHIPTSAWTIDQIQRVRSALTSNSQIRDCVLQLDKPTPAPEAVARFFSRHGFSIQD